MLQSISSEKSECLLAGDYNVDLFKYESNTGTETFVNNLYCHLCLPLITRPTRLTEVSSTPIYNIITNTFNECSSSGVLITDISDHLPIFYILNEPAIIDTLVNENLFHRNITEINIIKFKDALTHVQWNDDIELNDVNACYENY